MVYRIGLVVGLMVSSCPSFAAVLTFEQAAEIALRDNTDILQIRAQEDSAKHHQSQAWAPNTPQFSFTNSNSAKPLMMNEGASKSYGLQWTLGFPGKALIQSKQFGKQAESTREQGLEKEVSILVSLSNIYISISANKKLISILRQEVQKTQEVVQILLKKYAMGQASQVDLLSSKSAVAKLNHDLLNAQEMENVLQTQFLNILRKPESLDRAQELDSIEVPKITVAEIELIQVMLKNRHALKSADHQVAAADSAVWLAGMTALPDLQLTAAMNLYSLAASQPNPTLQRDYNFGFQINIPIFFPINELGTLRAARSDRAAIEYQADSTRLQAISDLKSNYALYNAGLRQLESIEKFLLPATKASYDLVLKSYALGKADYLRLADARNNWVSTQKDEVSQRSQLAQLFNALTLNVGCDFRHKEGPHACQ